MEEPRVVAIGERGFADIAHHALMLAKSFERETGEKDFYPAVIDALYEGKLITEDERKRLIEEYV